MASTGGKNIRPYLNIDRKKLISIHKFNNLIWISELHYYLTMHAQNQMAQSVSPKNVVPLRDKTSW